MDKVLGVAADAAAPSPSGPSPVPGLGASHSVTNAQREGWLKHPTSWPRAATPCDLVPMWAGEFRDFQDWVAFASKRLTGVYGSVDEEVKAICVDAIGRRCNCGRDFARARDEGTFPVRYFWQCQPAEGRAKPSDTPPGPPGLPFPPSVKVA